MTDGPNSPTIHSATKIIINGYENHHSRDDNGSSSDDGDTVTLTEDSASGPPTPRYHSNSFSSLKSAVGNLIEFSDSGGEDGKNQAVMAPVLAQNGRLSTSPMNSEAEESFEGVANGFMNGTTGNLLDNPLDPIIRPTTSSSPASPPFTSNGLSFAPGHRKVPSASQLASHLYNHSRSAYSNGSRRSSFNSDVENMSVSDAELHSEISDISSQVQKIHKQLAMFEEQHMVTDEKHVRLKQDNAVLQERLHALEEQMQQAEERWKDKLKEERQKNKDLTARLEREKSLEMESVTLKYQILQKEHGRCVEEKEKLTDQLERLKLENSQLKEQNEDLLFRAKKLEEENSETEREFRKYQVESEAEMARNSDALEEISRQNEELQRFARRPRQMSIADRAVDLAEELQRLREEYKSLQDRNDELHAELLQAQIETGRNLLADGPSLASEMDGKDKDELINALKEQEVCNQKLRAYIEGILIRVIEKHPDLLEVHS